MKTFLKFPALCKEIKRVENSNDMLYIWNFLTRRLDKSNISL